MDNVLKFKIAFPVLFIAVGLFIARFVDFSLVLTPSERRMVSFAGEEVLLQGKKERPAVAANMKSPMDIPSKGFPSVSLEQVAPQQPLSEDAGPEFKVSMIVIGGKSRMAIVNEAVVREGSVVNKMVVKKIEKDRVLLAGNDVKGGKSGSLWFYLEETKK